MRICEYGNKENPSILYIPGLFMSGECFEEIAAHLTEYHCVCITLDGMDGKEDYMGLEEEKKRLIHILGERKMTEYEVVVGMSLGTIFAMELARCQELRIKKVFLDGAVNFYTSKFSWVERKAMNYIFNGYRKSASDKEKLIQKMEKSFQGNWPVQMQACMAAVSRESNRAIVDTLIHYAVAPGVRQPIRCIYGGKETNAKINAHLIKRYYPDAEIEIIPGYNHLVYANHHPEKFAGRIINFIKNQKS